MRGCVGPSGGVMGHLSQLEIASDINHLGPGMFSVDETGSNLSDFGFMKEGVKSKGSKKPLSKKAAAAAKKKAAARPENNLACPPYCDPLTHEAAEAPGLSFNPL
eukprot:TRINITY_DN43489_c0_g1_i1.p3 TRINITY_DN43489_c0_g1~~TRINITY_DN43489_c0_g1_i1.p3  ORF type:complete len:105 (+),score=36.56 TRINITY_DN43489_c0_g1_i1:73-387(+)